MLKELTSDRFDTLVLNAEHPVILKFTADWCPGCQQIAPVVESVAAELENVEFFDVDVDKEIEFAQNRFNVRGIPTLLLFKNGKEVDRVVAPNADEDVIRTFATQ